MVLPGSSLRNSVILVGGNDSNIGSISNLVLKNSTVRVADCTGEKRVLINDGSCNSVIEINSDTAIISGGDFDIIANNGKGTMDANRCTVADPMFTSEFSHSVSALSPAKDSANIGKQPEGVPMFDVDGNERVLNYTMDIGAFEYPDTSFIMNNSRIDDISFFEKNNIISSYPEVNNPQPSFVITISSYTPVYVDDKFFETIATFDAFYIREKRSLIVNRNEISAYDDIIASAYTSDYIFEYNDTLKKLNIKSNPNSSYGKRVL